MGRIRRCDHLWPVDGEKQKAPGAATGEVDRVSWKAQALHACREMARGAVQVYSEQMHQGCKVASASPEGRAPVQVRKPDAGLQKEKGRRYLFFLVLLQEANEAGCGCLRHGADQMRSAG